MLKIVVLLAVLYYGAAVAAGVPAVHAASTPIAAVTWPIRPRKLRIKEAVEYSRISRSKLYELAPQYPGLMTNTKTRRP